MAMLRIVMKGLTSSMSWNSVWLVLSEMWMDSRRVYCTLHVLMFFMGLMESMSCDHSLERSFDEE